MVIVTLGHAIAQPIWGIESLKRIYIYIYINTKASQRIGSFLFQSVSRSLAYFRSLLAAKLPLPVVEADVVFLREKVKW